MRGGGISWTVWFMLLLLVAFNLVTLHRLDDLEDRIIAIEQAER